MGQGGFILVRGGHRHSSHPDKKKGALIYEESAGKFDVIPEKK
jgi:hypothetical protein